MLPPKKDSVLNKMVYVRPRFVLIVLAALTIFFGVAYIVQSAQVRRLNKEAAEVQALVVAAQDKTKELERRLEFSNTDEYVEQEARRRFGYLGPGEIRFMFEETAAPTGDPAALNTESPPQSEE